MVRHLAQKPARVILARRIFFLLLLILYKSKYMRNVCYKWIVLHDAMVHWFILFTYLFSKEEKRAKKDVLFR